MNICRTCHLEIPDKYLVCPTCTEFKSTQALREHQFQFLRKVAAGETDLITRRMPDAPSRHVQMFGAMRSFCGLALEPKAKPGWIPYEPDAMARICPSCRGEIERLIEAAERTAPVPP
jgi:hypothetical protein